MQRLQDYQLSKSSDVTNHLRGTLGKVTATHIVGAALSTYVVYGMCVLTLHRLHYPIDIRRFVWVGGPAGAACCAVDPNN